MAVFQFRSNGSVRRITNRFGGHGHQRCESIRIENERDRRRAARSELRLLSGDGLLSGHVVDEERICPYTGDMLPQGGGTCYDETGRQVTYGTDGRLTSAHF